MNRILKLSVFICSVLLAHATSAQSDSTTSNLKTLFGTKTKINYLGVYVSPEFSYGQLNGSFAPGFGGAFMLQVNQKWGLGLNVFSVNGRSTDIGRPEGATFSGLKLEYTLNPNKLFHLSIPLAFGVAGHPMKMGRFERNHDRFEGDDDGRHGYPSMQNDPNADRPAPLDRDFDGDARGAFIQPGVNIESNLFRYAKIYAGAKYRVAFNNAGFNNDLSGFSANIGLKLGIFDMAIKKKK